MILLDTDHTTFLKYPDSERGRRLTRIIRGPKSFTTETQRHREDNS